VFAAVAEEVGRLFRTDVAGVTRYEPGEDATVVASWSERGETIPIGTRISAKGDSVSNLVLASHAPARVDAYTQPTGPVGEIVGRLGIRATVGAPIIMDGRVWGALNVASTHPEPFPADTEARLAHFTELVATAISNAQARSDLSRLAEEQAALRRVATLVARGAPPHEVFEAVAAEVGRLLPVSFARLGRYEPDGTHTALGGWTPPGNDDLPVGTRESLEEGTIVQLVFETGRPARVDGVDEGSHSITASLRSQGGLRSKVGVPIIVEGRLWGVVGVASTGELLPANAETRLAEFTELVATAIANADSRAELEASRARIVTAADETRRQIERDLHDGAQQRLVSLGLELRAAEETIPSDQSGLKTELARLTDGLTAVLDEIREMSHGIYPAVLSEGGLGSALKSLSRRSVFPVELEVGLATRLPERIETAAYFVVSEALANTAKHAQASSAHVHVDVDDRTLRVSIQDDGVGGADLSRGSGLIGLTDRVGALGGTLAVLSPIGTGTTIRIQLPLDEF
jgi:signal transduction histidine kinase